MTDRPALREYAGFALGGFGQNLVYNLMTLYLLVYLVDGLRLSTGAIASLTVVLTVAKIWDAVNDLIAGVLVDRTRTRWGTFRPWIVGTALPIGLLTAAIFLIPVDAGERTTIVAVAVIYLLWDAVYTLSDLSFWALTAAITTTERARTGLIALGRAAALVAVAAMTLLGPTVALALSEPGSSAPTAQGWGRFGALVAAVGMALFVLAGWLPRERVPHRPDPVPWREAYGHLARNRPLLLLLLALVIGFGQMVFQVGGALLASVVFGDVAAFQTLGAALIVGVLISTLAAPAVLRRMTRRSALVLSFGLGAAVSFTMYAVGWRSLLVSAAMLALLGLSIGLQSVVQTAMIADAADWSEITRGHRGEGSCFAGQTFATKLSLALATMVFGLAVAGVGYQAGVVVTDGMRDGLWFAATVVPGVSSLLALVPLWWYRVPERELPALLEAARTAHRLL